MITPLDIRNKSFNKALRGYSSDEVDEFLDRLIEDYEKIFKENIELKDKLNVQGEALQHYKSMEETLQNTLIIAQNTAEDIKKNAYAKADNSIKEAEMRAGKIVADASEEVVKVRKELEEIKRQYIVFKTKFEALINAHLELLRNTFVEEFRSSNE